jgi:hypothetical protein
MTIRKVSRYAIRLAFLMFYGIAIFITFAFNNTGGIVLALVALLMQLIAGPPIVEWIESAFDREPTPEEDYREYVQKTLVDKVLNSTLNQHYQPLNGKPIVQEPKLQPILETRLFSEEERNKPKSESEYQIQSERIYDEITTSLKEYFNKCSRESANETPLIFLLAGQEGSGKSAQLWMLMDELCKTRDRRIPVYVQLTSWVAGCKDFEKWITKEIAYQCVMTEQKARRLIANHNLTLLLDDYDRLPAKQRPQFNYALQAFLKERFRDRKIRLAQDAVVIASSDEEVGEGADYFPSILEAGTDFYHLGTKLMQIRQGMEQSIRMVWIAPLQRGTIQDYLNERQVENRSIDQILYRKNLRTALQRVLYLKHLPYSLERPKDLQINGNDTDVKSWRTDIIRTSLPIRLRVRSQENQSPSDTPENLKPTESPARDLNKLLEWLAKRLKDPRTALDVMGQMKPIYLEEIVLNPYEPKENWEWKRFAGLVTLLTSLILPLIFAVFYLLYHFTIREAVGDPLNGYELGIGSLVFFVFGRIFGQVSTSLEYYRKDDDRASLRPRTRWHLNMGFVAALFLSPMLGVVFYSISTNLYLPLYSNGLLYESAVYAIFSFPLFMLIGGLEVGRRYDVVAFPGAERRFTALVTLLAIGFWVAFFFAFILWPRTPAEIMFRSEIITMLEKGFGYAVVWGGCWGVISGFVLCHEFFRHWFMAIYIHHRYHNFDSNLQTQLHDLTESGILVQHGGGYHFRNEIYRQVFAGELDRNVNNPEPMAAA